MSFRDKSYLEQWKRAFGAIVGDQKPLTKKERKQWGHTVRREQRRRKKKGMRA